MCVHCNSDQATWENENSPRRNRATEKLLPLLIILLPLREFLKLKRELFGKIVVLSKS